MTVFGKYLIIAAIVAALASFTSEADAKDYRDAMDIPPTPYFSTVWSQNSPDVDPSNESKVAFLAKADDPNKLICVGISPDDGLPKGNYLARVYGDDPGTPEKDGADPNEKLEVMIYDGVGFRAYEADANDFYFDWSRLGDYIELDVAKGERVKYSLPDLLDYAYWWMADCDGSNNHCGWWDVDLSGFINYLKDFGDLHDNWEGNEPPTEKSLPAGSIAYANGAMGEASQPLEDDGDDDIPDSPEALEPELVEVE